MILKTENGGETWFQQPYQGQPASAYFDSVSAVDANVAWVACGWSSSYQIIKTVDGGLTWGDPVLTLDCNGYISVESITAFDANTAMATGMGPAIFRMDDGGSTWRQQLGHVPSQSEWIRGACFATADVAWAGGEGTIYHTVDGGGLGVPLPEAGSIIPTQSTIGSEVTITGSNFGDTRGESFVSFYFDKATEYTYWSNSMIKCKIPQTEPGPTKVRVENVYGSSAFSSSTGALDFAVIPVDYPPPTVTSIQPSSAGNLGSVQLDIRGSGFVRGATVRLESGTRVIETTGYMTVNKTSITCTIDPRSKPLGKYDVVVKNIDGQEGRLVKGFALTNVCGLGAGASISPVLRSCRADIHHWIRLEVNRPRRQRAVLAVEMR